MAPFTSPHQSHNPRFAANADLSYLTENMSLNKNNHSPPTSNSGGQSPEHNSPQSPTLSRVDRTASRYAMVDNSGKQHNGNRRVQPYIMEQGRFDNSISQSGGMGSPWATNAASNQANAILQATENNYSSPMASQYDAATAITHAVQQAMIQPGPQGQGFNPTLDLPQTIITERSLQNASCYAVYRGNGQYTRLVALDELPPIAGMPAIVPLNNGMIILPIPRQHQAVKMPQWAQQVGPLTPGSTPGSGGSMGSGRYYDVMATAGHTPGAPFAPAPHFAGRAISGGGGGIRSFSNNTTPARKEKIYCDKWVHDGVCAFAQQGCKYKHEMPLDIPTQRSLGLFHGLPAWWKREHGLEMKRTDGGIDGEKARRSSEVERHRESIRESLRGPPPGDRGLSGGLSSWRLPVEKRPSNTAVSQNVPRAGGLFGNIGSRTTSSTKSGLSNSYSILDVEDPTSPVSSNGGINNNGGIAASMHAPFSPTSVNGHIVHGKLNGKAEAIGNGGNGHFNSQEGK